MTLCIVEVYHPDDPAYRLRGLARIDDDGSQWLWLPSHPDPEVAYTYRPVQHWSDYIVTQVLAQLGDAAQSA